MTDKTQIVKYTHTEHARNPDAEVTVLVDDHGGLHIQIDDAITSMSPWRAEDVARAINERRA